MHRILARRTKLSLWLPVFLAGCLLGWGCERPPEDVAEPPLGLEYVPPAPGSYELPPIQEAANGMVIDADGTEHPLFDYMGDRLVLLSPIYTRCRDAKGCPLATGVFQMMERKLEEDPVLRDRVRLITMSFDPERDTPEVLRQKAGEGYIETPRKDRTWVYLTTRSQKELQPILDGFGQYVVREVDENGDPTGDYTHVLKVFLIDRQLRVRNIYSTSFLHPALALNDLRTLVLEEEEET